MTHPLPIREGQTIGHFRIEEMLGGGGMGVIYKAQHVTLGRTVALKFLPSHLASDESSKQRFIHEAKAASALDHPNICTIYEIGEHEGRFFIAMACYDGETLQRKIERGPLPVREAVDYAAQMAEGLSCAHEAGVVHRDVKPANVIVTERGRVKLLDFGLAKVASELDLTQTGATVGTAVYMSPEQARGEAVDHRTDLWALGVVLYEMLTGERPFRGTYAQAVVYQILHEEPKPMTALRPEVPERLADVVRRALAKTPDDRYQVGTEMLDDLEAFGKDTGHKVSRAAAGPDRAKRPYVYAGLIALLILSAGAAFLLWRAVEPADQRKTAALPVVSDFDRISVAVLPFENLSGDPGQDYFANGLSEDVLQALAQSPDLRVVGRTSSFVFRETNALADSIGRALGVAYLVRGSIRRDEDRIRVSAQLIDAKTGFEAWSSAYERPVEDVFDVQYQIARSVARQLSLATELARIEPGTENADAYTLVQQAEAVRRLDISRGARGADAEELYLRALDRDSTYAAAWSGLAWARYMQNPRTDHAWTMVREAAERALLIDDADADAHHLLGEVARYRDYDIGASQTHFERAVEADPSNAYLRVTLAELLIEQLKREEALQVVERAVQLGPLEEIVLNIAGIVYYRAGLYERATDAFRSALALSPDLLYATGMLASLQAILGQTDEALALIERSRMRNPNHAGLREAAAYVYARAGRRDDAERMLENIPQAYHRAVVEAALGNRDAAFAALERSIDADEYALHELAGGPTDPRLRPLYDDPRWEPFVARVRSDEWRDGEWGRGR